MKLQPTSVCLSAVLLSATAAGSRTGQNTGIPSPLLQAELVAELNGMVDKYRKLVTTSLSQNWKELKVRKVTVKGADEQFMHVELSVRVREINGLTGIVLYTRDGKAKGKFTWGTKTADRLCITTPLGQGWSLVVTETKDIPAVGTPDEARAAEMAIKANFPREACVLSRPTISVSGAIATEKTPGAGPRHPPRPNKLVFTVTLSNRSAQNVRVKFGTNDDTAKAGQDYKADGGELLIPDGEKSKDIEVPIIPRDGSQGSRRMILKLWSPVNGKLIRSEANGVILDTGQSIPGGPVPIPRP